MPAAIAWLAKPALTIVRLTFFILHIEFPLLWIILQHPQIDALPERQNPIKPMVSNALLSMPWLTLNLKPSYNSAFC
jgi:hypothetical protein